MFRFLYLISYPFLRLFLPCKVVNRKNYLKKQPAIVVCNHLSNLDVIYLVSYIYEKKYFLAKKELFNTKIKNKFLRHVGGIPIDRNSSDITAMKNCLNVLKKGKKLVIFPEGTRNKQNTDLQEVKNGSVMFAIKARVPIIPMRIEKRGKWFRRNKLIIGESFELSEFYGQKLTSEVLDQASLELVKHLNELEGSELKKIK